MTLALRPQLIEEGEWIAHQCMRLVLPKSTAADDASV